MAGGGPSPSDYSVAYRDIWNKTKMAANSERDGAYEAIINNMVDHKLAACQPATAQWLLGTVAAGSTSDSWADRRGRGGSVSSWRGEGRSRFNPY